VVNREERIRNRVANVKVKVNIIAPGWDGRKSP